MQDLLRRYAQIVKQRLQDVYHKAHPLAGASESTGSFYCAVALFVIIKQYGGGGYAPLGIDW